MKQKRSGNQGKSVSFFHSFRFLILGIVIGPVILSTLLTIFLIVPLAEKNLQQTTQNSMLSEAEAYGNILETALSKESDMNYTVYKELLQDAKLKGLDSSYVYVVESTGTMLYHPTEEKVGQPVENVVVTKLVEDIQAGQHPDDAVVDYDFNGTIKYASYHVLSNNSILVVSADETDVLSSIKTMEWRSYIGSIIILVVMIILGLLASKKIIHPISKIADIINKTAQFDFRENEELNKMSKAKNEAGMMACAVQNMGVHMRNLVDGIEQVSQRLTGNVTELQDISKEINSTCTDNSATTQQLAAGMEETSATTETINSNIGFMQEGAEDIRMLSLQGDNLSNEIKERAQALKTKTQDATERTQDMYRNVKAKTQDAIEQAKAVDKINQLTGAIMEISSQTNLLALNASIEAARAGEAGKGFAVVATEIGNLANQSSETVGDINNIIEEISIAVKHMTESLEETTEFLEEVVLQDYNQFGEVSEQYNSDSENINQSMKNIEASVLRLTDTINEISTALGGINMTINESTTGISDIAEKTADIVSKTIRNGEIVEECNVSAGELNEIAEKFTV